MLPQISRDPENDVVYIKLSNEKVAETVPHFGKRVLIDKDAAGEWVGIEVLLYE